MKPRDSDICGSNLSRGPSETDPQNRVSVAFDKREKVEVTNVWLDGTFVDGEEKMK